MDAFDWQLKFVVRCTELALLRDLDEVEAAVEIGTGRVEEQVVASRVIAQIHEEMDENLLDDGRFRKLLKEGS